MMQWKITITRYRKTSKTIPKGERRYSAAVGYMKKWAEMWKPLGTKAFKYPWVTTDNEQIKGYANILWMEHFKGQPRQVLIFLGDELRYGKDNLDKYMFK